MSLYSSSISAWDDDLRVTFFDVGQGDCTLIRLPKGSEGPNSAILIDCPKGRSRQILKALDELNVNRLEMVIITHTDEDHCGGIPDVLLGLSRKVVSDDRAIGQVLYVRDAPVRPGQTAPSRAYVRLADVVLTLEEEGKLYWHEPYLETRDIEEVRLQFLHPDKRDAWRSLASLDRNTPSQVLLLEYKGFRLLFAADLTQKSWDSIIRRTKSSLGADVDIENLLKVAVLKIPHHGGAWQSLERMKSMFGLLQPAYVVISAGSNNKYGHPSPLIFEALKDVSSLKRVLCTQATAHCCELNATSAYSCAGNVDIVINGNELTVYPDFSSHHARMLNGNLAPACARWINLLVENPWDIEI